MMQASNPRATIGKYRHLPHGDWTTILNQIKHGVRLAKINASTNNRPVTFTRAEVAFPLAKYGRAAWSGSPTPPTRAPGLVTRTKNSGNIPET